VPTVAETADVVVAGAGHNSLIAACYLAKAGLEVCVLEARDVIGGATASEELTLPGFVHDSCSTAHVLIQSSPTIRDDELGLLRDYGLEYFYPEIAVHVPFGDGTSITQYRDRARTHTELARFSHRDADAFVRMLEDYHDARVELGAGRYTPIGFGPSLEERLAGRPDAGRWLRRAAMSAWDVIKASLEDWHTRSFAGWLASQTLQPIDRQGTGLLAYSIAYGRDRHGWTIPRGGSGALPAACVRLIEAHGGRVLASRPVAQLVLDGGRCEGVETEDGERYLARSAVLSTIHVKHLVEMAPREAWDDSFVYGVETWKAGLSLFVTHLAVTEPPRFPVDGGVVEPVAMGTGVAPERLLRVALDFETGTVNTDDPPLLVVCPTVADPSRAPAGRHTLKILGYQPYELAEGPERWDEIKDEVSRANVRMLQRFAPNLSDDKILASVVKSPLDLERQNRHNWHGSCHGGDLGPAQSGHLRPAPGWASHRLPIPGLYQTGATTHPGGSVSGGPGRNAAMVLLHDLGHNWSGIRNS
jgi:phytoene dehydrogenase-like protein